MTSEARMLRLLTLLLLLSTTYGDDNSTNCNELAQNAINVTESCLKQLVTVCNHPELGWKFFDASSKFFTSGMSYSNVIDYGNFPECLSINYEDENDHILGKFCGFSVIVGDIFLPTEAEKSLRAFGIDTKTRTPQMVSKEIFAKLRAQVMDTRGLPDIGNLTFVISKYSSCVPDACTPREVGSFFQYGLIPIFVYTDLPCETVNSNTDYEAGDIVVICFFCFIASLMLVSTVYDAWCQNFRQKPYHPLCLSFSVLYNGKKLLQISNNTTEQIQCFNGMRFISMMWVVAFHAVSVFQAGVVGLENYPEVQDWDNSISNRYILSGLLAVDTFFFISGFLLAFSYLKSATNESLLEQVKKVPKMYLHRYLRLTPSVGVMYLVTITIFRFLGNGPNWTLIANFMKDACKKKWWEFFLYVQNYTDPDGMCINPTWYLSADMQMFILAPLVLIPMALFIKKKFKIVIGALVGLTVLSILIPMLIRYFVDEAPGNIYTAHERFNNFLIGITFGAYMRFYKHKPFIFSPIVNVVLWVVVLVVSLFFNLYWFDVLTNMTLLKYTLFMGFYRPVWCLSLAFMVYSCYHNHGGIIQWFLTLPSFQILGRLSYSMYVLHVLVELYAGATLKVNTYFSNYFLFYNWCGHFIVTMMASVIWVLAFEFPMLTIDKYILGDGGKKPVKVESEKQ